MGTQFIVGQFVYEKCVENDYDIYKIVSFPLSSVMAYESLKRLHLLIIL